MQNTKVVFKNTSEEIKKNFKNSQCLLTISVGQEVHEGEKFNATIDLINQYFKSCIIMVDDSLQRHTIALDKEEDADFFYRYSLYEGDLWLNRNKQYYTKLDIPTKILRWDDFLTHVDFQKTHTLLIKTMLEDSSYKVVFDYTIDEFLKRYYARLIDQTPNFNFQRARKLCFDYLIEECTSLCLWTSLNCNFEVYPGKRNLVMHETHQRFVLPFYPDLLHSVSLKFKNRKQLKKQQFELSYEANY